MSSMCCTGAAMPIFSLVIGRMVNTLGYGTTDGLTAELNQTTLFFLYLAIASFVVCYLEVGMWMLTGKTSAHPPLRLRHIRCASVTSISIHPCLRLLERSDCQRA